MSRLRFFCGVVLLATTAHCAQREKRWIPQRMSDNDFGMDNQFQSGSYDANQQQPSYTSYWSDYYPGGFSGGDYSGMMFRANDKPNYSGMDPVQQLQNVQAYSYAQSLQKQYPNAIRLPYYQQPLAMHYPGTGAYTGRALFDVQAFNQEQKNEQEQVAQPQTASQSQPFSGASLSSSASKLLATFNDKNQRQNFKQTTEQDKQTETAQATEDAETIQTRATKETEDAEAVQTEAARETEDTGAEAVQNEAAQETEATGTEAVQNEAEQKTEDTGAEAVQNEAAALEGIQTEAAQETEVADAEAIQTRATQENEGAEAVQAEGAEAALETVQAEGAEAALETVQAEGAEAALETVQAEAAQAALEGIQTVTDKQTSATQGINTEANNQVEDAAVDDTTAAQNDADGAALGAESESRASQHYKVDTTNNTEYLNSPLDSIYPGVMTPVQYRPYYIPSPYTTSGQFLPFPGPQLYNNPQLQQYQYQPPPQYSSASTVGSYTTSGSVPYQLQTYSSGMPPYYSSQSPRVARQPVMPILVRYVYGNFPYSHFG